MSLSLQSIVEPQSHSESLLQPLILVSVIMCISVYKTCEIKGMLLHTDLHARQGKVNQRSCHEMNRLFTFLTLFRVYYQILVVDVEYQGVYSTRVCWNI